MKIQNSLDAAYCEVLLLGAANLLHKLSREAPDGEHGSAADRFYARKLSVDIEAFIANRKAHEDLPR